MKALYIPSSKITLDESVKIQHEIYNRQLALASRSRLIEDHGEWGIWYLGSKEELIREGLAEAGWFPGEDGNGRNQQRVIFRENAQNGEVLRDRKVRALSCDRLITIFRLANNYRLFDCFPRVVRKEIRAIQRNKWHQEWLDEARRAEEQALGNLPNCGDEARDRVMPLVECLLDQILEHVVRSGVGGYCVAADEKPLVIDAVQRVSSLISDASFDLDVEIRKQIEIEIRHKTVQADRPYSSFIKQVLNTRAIGQED